MFTGAMVEDGQFAIFTWFPPHDADVSGIRWIKVTGAGDWGGARAETHGTWSRPQRARRAGGPVDVR